VPNQEVCRSGTAVRHAFREGIVRGDEQFVRPDAGPVVGQ
jgi:hypothetical protein